jgi:hypothetical protein
MLARHCSLVARGAPGAARAPRAAPRPPARAAAGPAPARAAPSRDDAVAQLEQFAAANKLNIAAAEQQILEKAKAGGAAAAAAAPAAPAGAGAAAEGGLQELGQANFWEFLEASSDKLTVVDFFTGAARAVWGGAAGAWRRFGLASLALWVEAPPRRRGLAR